VEKGNAVSLDTPAHLYRDSRRGLVLTKFALKRAFGVELSKLRFYGAGQALIESAQVSRLSLGHYWQMKIEVCGIPHLATNERDVGHPLVRGRDGSKKVTISIPEFSVEIVGVDTPSARLYGWLLCSAVPGGLDNKKHTRSVDANKSHGKFGVV
jgi:hypothetical protein